jgi:hypothetical protein
LAKADRAYDFSRHGGEKEPLGRGWLPSAAILEQVQADPDLARRFAMLTSIPGVSTAFALLIEMPELGALEPGKRQVSQALRPWRDSRVAGPVGPSSAPAEPTSDRRHTCRRWSRPDSILT